MIKNIIGASIASLVIAAIGPLLSMDIATACDTQTTTNCGWDLITSKCQSESSVQCPPRAPVNNTNPVVDLSKLKAEDPKLYMNYLKRSEDQSNICKSWRKAHRQNTAQYRNSCVAQHAQPKLTEDIVREQFRRLPLPRGDLTFQPSWGALVNKKEIFYTRAERDHDYRMTLLGHQVVLASHVQSYTWSWGDDSADGTFDVPGGPYPDFDVSHTYRNPEVCTVVMALTYSATYRIDGGPVQQVQGTVTVPGDPVDVRVMGAHAVLVQGGH